MRWFRSGLQSLSGWLAPPVARAATATGQQMEAIREAMLGALLPGRLGGCAIDAMP